METLMHLRGTRLLVTGGPLAYGLKGCYVGVWR